VLSSLYLHYLYSLRPKISDSTLCRYIHTSVSRKSWVIYFRMKGVYNIRGTNNVVKNSNKKINHPHTWDYHSCKRHPLTNALLYSHIGPAFLQLAEDKQMWDGIQTHYFPKDCFFVYQTDSVWRLSSIHDRTVFCECVCGQLCVPDIHSKKKAMCTWHVSNKQKTCIFALLLPRITQRLQDTKALSTSSMHVA
jgi:hypothetical protein